MMEVGEAGIRWVDASDSIECQAIGNVEFPALIVISAPPFRGVAASLNGGNVGICFALTHEGVARLGFTTGRCDAHSRFQKPFRNDKSQQ
jgi:hypothetical protein